MKRMVATRRALLIAVWAMSLVLVGTYGHSQTPPSPAQPTVLTANDVGFSLQRIERGYAGFAPGSPVAIGSWVVKVNGMWIPVQSVESPSMKRIGE